MGKSIEVMLASPPERDEIVAQLFHTNGGQWGEIYREDGVFKLELISQVGWTHVHRDKLFCIRRN